MAGAGGFEPPPSALTVRCPTGWTTPQWGVGNITIHCNGLTDMAVHWRSCHDKLVANEVPSVARVAWNRVAAWLGEDARTRKCCALGALEIGRTGTPTAVWTIGPRHVILVRNGSVFGRIIRTWRQRAGRRTRGRAELPGSNASPESTSPSGRRPTGVTQI
jgi:hypothetical protein